MGRPLGPLTDKQQALLDFIAKRIDEGKPPSVREMMSQFGWSSANAPMCHLRALAAKGVLVKDPGVRSWRVIRPDPKTIPFLGKIS